MLIGITGILGSGKSTFLNFFKEKKIPVFNSDEVVRKLYEKKEFLKIIKKQFPQFFKGDKFLKKEFSNYIFSSKENLEKLEEIIHPEVLKELIKFKEKNKGKISAAEVPLLFEKKLENIFDIIVCISTSEKIALKNFSKGKNISIQESKKRLLYQMPIKEKKKLSHYAIENDGTIEDLKKKFNLFLNEIKKKSL